MTWVQALALTLVALATLMVAITNTMHARRLTRLEANQFALSQALDDVEGDPNSIPILLPGETRELRIPIPCHDGSQRYWDGRSPVFKDHQTMQEAWQALQREVGCPNV